MGQQRVKLDGRAARDPFGGKDCRQHQCGKSPKILFRHEIEISYNVFFYFLQLTLSYSCAGPKWALSSSAPFSFFFAETFLTLQFSRTISRALQFLGNFSSGSEVGQKGLPVDSCTNIESSHATASNQPQTDFRQKAGTTSESENFLESHNQWDRKFSPERILLSRYRVSELEEGIISEGSFVNANIYWHLEKIWRGSVLNTE